MSSFLVAGEQNLQVENTTDNNILLVKDCSVSAQSLIVVIIPTDSTEISFLIEQEFQKSVHVSCKCDSFSKGNQSVYRLTEFKAGSPWFSCVSCG